MNDRTHSKVVAFGSLEDLCTQACFDFHTSGEKKQQLLSAQSNYKSKHKIKGTKPNDFFVKFLSLADVFRVDARSISTIFL